MKKIIAMVFSLMLVVNLAACGGGTKPFGTLVVGTAKLNGDFVSGFSNSSYDKHVRDLIYGYGTYATDDGGKFVLNETVVKSVDSSQVDADGNKTYEFTLNKDLKWSDGEKVTAKDYVFGILFGASPAWLEAGASDTTGDTLVGYGAYHNGESDVFAGVNLLDDYKFSVVISGEELPYFYEVAYAAFGPAPLHVWGQGVDVEQTDGGAKLVGDVAVAAEYVATKERYAPTVASGPFMFESFENDAAKVVVNPNYKGNFEGKKPKLEAVVVKYVNSATDVDLVISGDIDIAAGVIEGEKIEKAKAADTAGTISYKRNGYGLIAFSGDFGPTKDVLVRQALGFIIDRQLFIQNVLGGYGTTVNGDYGLSQWMYVAKKAEVQEQLTNYVYNIEEANNLLDQTEWKFEADGVTPWDRTKAAEGYYRHNAEGVMLVIEHLGTTDNPVTDTILAEMPKGGNLTGIKYNVEYGDFNALLDNYYYGADLGADRKYNAFNLATGFTAVYDPYYSYHSDHVGTWMNATGTNDAELDSLIEEMRALDPSETAKYADLWLKYQVRWNYLLPNLPIYSNEYFDIYNTRVQGLETTPLHDWAADICDISITE